MLAAAFHAFLPGRGAMHGNGRARGDRPGGDGMGERVVIAWWGWNGRARGDRLVGMEWASAR